MNSRNGAESSTTSFGQSIGGLYFAFAITLLFLVVVIGFGGAAFLSRSGPREAAQPVAAKPSPPPAPKAEPAEEKEREAMYAKLGAMAEELAAETAERTRLANRLEELMALRAELALDRPVGGQPASNPAETRAALLKSIQEVERELAAVSQVLDASEQRISAKQIQVAGIGARLNRALLARVEELQRGRSEFFDGLRNVLADRPGFRIEGDRFTLPSEVLFAPGADQLSPVGLKEVRRLAVTINEVRAQFPPGVDWVLRVSGHTDYRPIATARFPSNWELSAMRAVVVVKELIAAGVPPQHVAATGFGEFQPATIDKDEAALAKNRRIEFRLDH